jgi:TPR repeat protein
MKGCGRPRGDRDAQFALDTCFYAGEAVGKNPATARRWFGAAARRGRPDAMFSLGVMTAQGEGRPKDAAMAFVLFTLAGQAGIDGGGTQARGPGDSSVRAGQCASNAVRIAARTACPPSFPHQPTQ